MSVYMFPGQGFQSKGMGDKLFAVFPELTTTASEILGYSIQDLCAKDSHKQLNDTRYTQPALYVVNALSYQQRSHETEARANHLVGHSLGEFNALQASGAISFEDGLRLVKK
ncbi:acyltransferase domain-containing protein [Mycoavidus sp. SF9855]|nr:acyltransferase domain-containing protein [Mycoavidus sp. SF9855]UUM21844.1 acyltransferase domain-containing protein [Mycoavidus sp. SF9855]